LTVSRRYQFKALLATTQEGIPNSWLAILDHPQTFIESTMGPNPKTKAKEPKKATISGGQPQQAPMLIRRERSDSTGSTRGVFYLGNGSLKNADHIAPTIQQLASSKNPQQQHLRHRRGHKAKASGDNNNKGGKTTAASVADFAALAMEGLDPADIAPLPGTEPREALRPGAANKDRKRRKPRISRNEGPVRLDRLEHHPDSSLLDYEAKYGHPPPPGAALDSGRESGLFGAGLLDDPKSTFFDGSTPYGATSAHSCHPSQQEEINLFASMVHASDEYGATSDADDESSTTDYDDSQTEHPVVEDSVAGAVRRWYYWNLFLAMLDPTPWLRRGVKYDEDTKEEYFEDNAIYSLSGLVRHFLYNPICPEFTSLQQFSWACLIGAFMGLYTAFWKIFIEIGVEFVWETIPEFLLGIGVFTELVGARPLYHYMWICPSIFGGLLSWIFVVIPTKIPDQNTWINALHSRGVQDHETFIPLFLLSTMGMWSGLSLGPELPLVLTGGMLGSWLALLTKQSMLQARVLNLTAASAAVGGFFGFPMAGALFVLEM
jgi:Voltage gated chloride channel